MTTTTQRATSPVLDAHALKSLAGRNGPCLTMVIPAHHPGAHDGSRRAVIQSLIRTAREEVSRGPLAPQADNLMGPIEAIAHETDVEAGGPGLVIFRSPDYLERYSIPGRPAAKVVIGEHFYVTPFVKDASSLREFFVLGLSKKHLRLFRYVNGECQELLLPAAIPPSLEAASGLNQPEHNLEGRSPSGPSTGAMKGVHFGIGTDRETAGGRLHHFFALVDRGMTQTFGHKPLVLLGVREEVAEYRRMAKHTRILNSDIHGNADFLSPAEIATLAGEAIRNEYDHLAERVLAEYRDMPDRSRTLADIAAVLQAASEGRVHRLCVRAVTEEADPFANPGNDSLVNTAIIDTVRTGGEVFIIPQHKLPGANPLAAILRY